ncbi:MAG: phage portal protein [Oscillospiraceae bacterium]|nr:phage portal protein [Oscillospiraceae bacterium]
MTIPDIVNGAMQQHLKNRVETQYLYQYYKGNHPIFNRIKTVRPEINNKIVLNNAYAIVRNANGYFLGEPIKYTSKGSGTSENIEKLNEFMDSEDKACADMDVGEWASICGSGYRLVATDAAKDEDEAPFEIPTLDSRNTFVIYSTSALHEPMLGVTYYNVTDDYGNEIGRSYMVYDKIHQYRYDVDGVNSAIEAKDLVSGYPKMHLLGDIPIVEYKNNQNRIGDFEIVITILDALDKLQSDRVNSVEQLVSSLLVFTNCHLKTKDESSDGISDFDKLKQGFALEMESDKTNPADVKYVNCGVDQNEAETLAQTLIDYVYAITGIPDRKQKAGGTGDTGDAVYLRDGYQSLEVVARCKQRQFKKSERRMLRMICKVLDTFSGIQIKPMNIEVNFVRNRTNNLLSKAQAMSTLNATHMFAPIDSITLGGVTEMPSEMAKRGEAYWKQKADEANNAIGNQNEANNADQSKGKSSTSGSQVQSSEPTDRQNVQS